MSATLRCMGVLPYFAAAAVSFAVYVSNGQTLASYDSAPNSLAALNLIIDHRIDFDNFRAGYFGALGGQYAFVEAPNGHLASVFPIGTAIVTLPLYAGFALAARDTGALPPLDSPAFEPYRQRYEKTAAAAIAALSVGLFLLCAREIGTAAQAGIATLVYAFATPLWSIASQALWQHGPVNLFVLAAAYALLRADRARKPNCGVAWLVAGGACAGFLPVVRPTAMLFVIAFAVFAGWRFGRRSWPFFAALAAGILPGAAWNGYFFHTPAGGYAVDAGAYAFAPQPVLTALAGLIISPSRGIVIFCPLFAFAAFGVARAARRHDARARLITLLAVACGALVVQYACFRCWWSGFCYGPRFMTDTAGVAALLLVYVVPAHPLVFARRHFRAAAATAAFIGLFIFSAGVQFVGVNGGAAGSEWNAVPVSIDRNPRRVWQTVDSQIERNARATYFRLFAWNAGSSPGYAHGLAAHVRALTPVLTHIAAGSSIDATALLHNDGRSAVYGYDSGVYLGQMRVHVRILDAKQQTFSDQNLYVDGSPSPGGHADAIGTIMMPHAAGTYRLECDPELVGGGALRRAAPPLRIVLRVS